MPRDPDLKSKENIGLPRLVIAGVGLITPLGTSAWQTFTALLAGRRLTDRVDKLEDDTEPVPLAQALGGVSVARHTATDPTVELAERAAREAATEAGLDLAGLPTWLGTSKGAVGAMSHGVTAFFEKNAKISSRLAQAVALGPHGYLSHHLAARTAIDIRGHAVAACASSLTALHHARQHLVAPPNQSQAPPADSALVLTSEAALLPAFIHSYRRLGVLAPMTLAGYQQRPLHADRQGFVLSEVGAAVLLKRLPPGQSPAPGQIELLDTAVATEAYDLIRPSPDMHALRVVAQQLIANRPVAALHPHATGTPEHDPTELRILGEVFHDHAAAAHHQHGHAAPNPSSKNGADFQPPAVYANKGALGHSLGSAGLVSLVIACLCARTRKLPPMPWLDTPMPNAPIALTATPTLEKRPGGHVVTAAGFGGHVAGALIQRVEPLPHP